MSLPELVTIHTSLLTDLGDAVRERFGVTGDKTLPELTAIVRLLPSEYQQVDYIQSSGTQRIETGVINNTLNVPITYEFGVNYSSTSSRQLQGTQGGLYVGVVNGKWQSGQAGTTATSINAEANKWYRVKFFTIPKTTSEAKKIFVEEKDQTGNFYAETPFHTADVSNDYNVCVFSLNGQNLPSTCAVSFFRVWQNNVLVRDLIPCYRKSDNEIGMYDIINNQFYTNAGSGSFTCYPAPPSN